MISMNYFRNYDLLLSHGNSHLRKEALDILNAGLLRADPGKATRGLVRLDGGRIVIGGRSYDLDEFRNVYVIGAGKASFPIAAALDDILGKRIAGGIVICKNGQEGHLENVDVRLASHPIPNEDGMRAAEDVFALAKRTGPGDLVFACVTGGSSALMPLPIPEISLSDKKIANRILLTCGANIIEINAVRKHLSLIKGGRLAQAVHPEALLVNLTVSDVIGDPLDYITDPTVPDTSSFRDAANTMNKYVLWDRMPAPVSAYLRNPPAGRETPKSLDTHRIENHIIVAGDAACTGAEERARELGFRTVLLSTMFEGESRELGRTFGFLAKEVLRSAHPLEAPCAFIGGGETVVTIHPSDPEPGLGGPNQEFALGAALEIRDLENVVVAGLDTDGTDGPTPYAGGIADGNSFAGCLEKGIDLYAALGRHDASEVLNATGDILITGNTGTNVNDLKIMLVR
jgi:hydroxypyruvate reductase/glycerate 2-kinase